MGIYLPMSLRRELEVKAAETGLKMSTIIQKCLSANLKSFKAPQPVGVRRA